MKKTKNNSVKKTSKKYSTLFYYGSERTSLMSLISDEKIKIKHLVCNRDGVYISDSFKAKEFKSINPSDSTIVEIEKLVKKIASME